MKRRDLLRHLKRHGCELVREGANHTVYVNRRSGKVSTVPRHREINEFLARRSVAISMSPGPDERSARQVGRPPVQPAALPPPAAPRKIIHVDMDAFYASVEQRDDPALRGRPVAVGGGGPRGVVMAASYEARVFGVRSAMPGFQARRLCPELVFVRTRFDAYQAASHQIREIFLGYTDLVEPLSLDEAYLDVTAPKCGTLSATAIARAIKREILAATGLTASAGVSFNKFLAKVASDIEKPDGLTVIRPQDAQAFIAKLPIERFFGVGPVTARKMKEAGIHDGADLCARSEAELVNRFGKVGRHYFRIARGEDDRTVSPDRPYKSIGAEETFATDLRAPDAMLDALRPIAERVAERMAQADLFGRTVTLKIKHHDFTLNTRQHTLADPVHSAEELMALARWLLHTPAPPARPVRLLGLTASNFARASPATAPVQLTLGIADLAPPAPAPVILKARSSLS